MIDRDRCLLELAISQQTVAKTITGCGNFFGLLSATACGTNGLPKVQQPDAPISIFQHRQ
jgi:hypothetical protein